jgi:hypothetical protein
MNFVKQILVNLFSLFEGLENIGSHLGIEGFILGIAAECENLVAIIKKQDQEIERQRLEITALKAELELANRLFYTVNADLLHMRVDMAQVLQPPTRKIEELY